MLARALIGLIRLYQLAVSPWTPASCRFTPTCSSYAREAIERHGAGRGGWLAVRRLLRCHPWGGYGYDPVPHHPAHEHPGHVHLAAPQTPGEQTATRGSLRPTSNER